jgi:hypothetical protein
VTVRGDGLSPRPGSLAAAQPGAGLAVVDVVVAPDQATADQVVRGSLEVVPQRRAEATPDRGRGDGFGVELGQDLAGGALDGGGVVVLVERGLRLGPGTYGLGGVSTQSVTHAGAGAGLVGDGHDVVGQLPVRLGDVGAAGQQGEQGGGLEPDRGLLSVVVGDLLAQPGQALRP